MLKRLAILTVLLAVAPIVSCQPDRAAEHIGNDAEQSQPAVVAPNGKDKHPSGQTDQSKPNGIPPSADAAIERPQWWADSNWWLVIIAGLTGGIICWQSWLTRRAAAISQRALVLEFRPRVIVRTVKMTPINVEPSEIEDWQIEMVIANIGGTMAYIQPWTFRMEWYDLEHDRSLGEIAQSSANGFELAGGQSNRLQVALIGEQFKISMHTLNFSVQETGIRQRRYPTVSGTIIYQDDNKITRRTGFRRTWNVKEERFCPSVDPEYEYQD